MHETKHVGLSPSKVSLRLPVLEPLLTMDTSSTDTTGTLSSPQQ